MCADQAAKVFKEYQATSYTDHYDAATQICYLEMSNKSFTSGFSQTITVSDAFENRIFGTMIFSHDYARDSRPDNLIPPVECKIKPRDQAEIVCHSRNEFDSLVLKYFGTTADD